MIEDYIVSAIQILLEHNIYLFWELDSQSRNASSCGQSYVSKNKNIHNRNIKSYLEREH